MADKKACIIVGAGPGIGSAVAREFSLAGYEACLARRPRNIEETEISAAKIRAEGGSAHAFGTDARIEEDIVSLFETVERTIAPIDVVVFNVGGNVAFPTTETTEQVYRKVWEMTAFGGFLTGREAARYMEPRKQGTIIFTGASASMRGKPNFAAFSGGKHALRSLAQSMARELGPKGIHVAHTVIDGGVDTKFVRERFSDAEERLARDGLLLPAEIAKNYLWLHNQHRSAWTHELDLRPWCENW